MASAIVHFLVGASLFLLLATPFAVRFERVRDSALLLVTAGGIWGLIPDVHHFSPVFSEQLRAVHRTPVVDLFAFHYMLDLDPVRERQRFAIFVALVLFCLAVAIFTAASRIGTQYENRRITVGTETVSGILAGAFIATMILGTTVYSGGYLDSLGMLTGRGIGVGMLLVGVCATVAATGFGLLVELGPGAETLSPVWAAVVGLGLGAVAWLVAVVMVLPIFLVRFYGAALSLSHVDSTSFVGFVVAGGALAVAYVVVARRVAEESTRRSDQFSLQR
jgi:hypothetical protein